MGGNDEQRVGLKIPKELYDLLLDKMKETSISRVDDFATYLLHESIGKRNETFSEADMKRVEERLRALGYV